MTEEKPDPFKDITDEQLEDECRDRDIWNEWFDITACDTDDLLAELQQRNMVDGDTLQHRCREVMRTGSREALWELVRTEVQEFLGVIV